MSILTILLEVAKIVMGIYVMKCLVVGSEFNLVHWWKYGKHYTRWYDSRPQFDPETDIPPPKEPFDEALDMLEKVVDHARQKVQKYEQDKIQELFSMKDEVVRTILRSIVDLSEEGFSDLKITFPEIYKPHFDRGSVSLNRAPVSFAEEVICALREKGFDNCTYKWTSYLYDGTVFERTIEDAEIEHDEGGANRLMFMVTWGGQDA